MFGALVLALHAWLAALYRVDPGVVVFVACANLAYGSYSGALTVWRLRGDGPLTEFGTRSENSRLPPVFRRRSVPLGPTLPFVTALAAANLAWPIACVALSAATWSTASPLAHVHFLGEAVFVGVLGAVEWRVLRPLAR